MLANEINKDRLQVVGASGEFLLVGDANGKLWAFPRIHMISATVPEAGLLVFDFNTHCVTIHSNDSTGDLKGWLATKFDLLAVPGFRPIMTQIRQVLKVDVEAKTKAQG